MMPVFLKQSSRNLTKIRILSSYNKYEIHQKKYFSSENQQNEMMSYYPDVVKKMKDIVKTHDPVGEGKYFERMLHYNLSGGKNTRGSMVVSSFKEMAPKKLLNEENLKLANYLGWCIELSHGIILMFDDIMDGSTMRRGKLCWYKQEDVQLVAINDGWLLKSVLYEFLSQYFSHLPCYIDLVEALNATQLYTFIGQQLDTKSSNQDVLTFTMEQYKKTAVAKTSDGTVYTPLQLGMILAGSSKNSSDPHVKNILYDMGYFFQAQDDFIDCYGDPKVTGKDGTDIADGKCTWFSVTFLNLANDAQKAKMSEFYGKKDKEAVKTVKKLYEEVRLREAFEKFEDDTYNYLKSEIKRTQGIPVNLCLAFMDKLYKRKF